MSQDVSGAQASESKAIDDISLLSILQTLLYLDYHLRRDTNE
jgi:hypothetical protein